MENLTSIIEAILFVSGDPVRTDALAHAMNLTVSELNEALSQLGDIAEVTTSTNSAAAKSDARSPGGAHKNVAVMVIQ